MLRIRLKPPCTDSKLLTQVASELPHVVTNLMTDHKLNLGFDIQQEAHSVAAIPMTESPEARRKDETTLKAASQKAFSDLPLVFTLEQGQTLAVGGR